MVFASDYINMQPPTPLLAIAGFTLVSLSGCTSLFLDPVSTDFTTGSASSDPGGTLGASSTLSAGTGSTSHDAPTTAPSDESTSAPVDPSTGSGEPTTGSSATDPGDPSAGETTTGSEDLCGNGAPDVGEVCDDGNLLNQDNCTNACVPQACGDGFLGPEEACDDGDNNDGDGCSSDCQCELLACGNGKPDLGEICDDGNNAQGDGCSACCQRETLLVFVTSMTYPIEFGGSFDADVRCMIAAEAAGLPGDFFAWLGLKGLPISEYVGIVPKPYALLDGTIVATSSEELFSGQLQAPINVTEFGVKLPMVADACGTPSHRVWTGIAANGGTTEANCNDWKQRGAVAGRIGGAGETDARWTDCGEDLACPTPARLYCFENFMLGR